MTEAHIPQHILLCLQPQISSDLREEIFDEQRDCYNLMYSKGWYKLEQQPKSKITQDVQKFNQSK